MMQNHNMSFSDIYKLVNDHKKSTILIFVITFATIAVIPKFLKKRYKSTGIVNVYSSYFKNPMVREIMPELHAQDEIRYNVFALIKNSINDEYIDSMAKEFQLYKYPIGSPRQQEERLLIRNKSFDIITLGPQTFSISFINSDPIKAKNVAKKTVDHIVDSLVKNRRESIKELMSAMKKRIELLNLANEVSSTPIVSKSPEVLQEEFLKINKSLEALSEEYSNEHPIVQNLLARKAIIERWMQNDNIGQIENEKIPVLGKNSKTVINDLLKDFLKKYNYLRVAYDVEKSGTPEYLSIGQRPSVPADPFFPKNIIFYAAGLVLASMLSLLNLLIRQMLKETTESIAKKLEEQLGGKFLGVLPVMNENIVVQSPEKSGKENDESIKWN